MVEVDSKYVYTAINDLFGFIGIKEEIQRDELLELVRQNKVQECIEKIAEYMLLPIKANVVFVPSDYHPSYAKESNFISDELVVTDSSGKGIDSIVAQILIPSGLPFFGSASLKNYPIQIRISDNVTKYPETFLAMVAHELSHLVLHALRYKEKDNEIHADITSMLLGFNSIVRDGRVVVEDKGYYTQKTTYGYMPDDRFDYAYSYISGILRENENIKEEICKKLSFLEKHLSLLKKKFSKIKYYKSIIDRAPKKRICQEDAQRIVLLHQPGYFAELESQLCAFEEKVKHGKPYKSKGHYHKNWHSNLIEYLSKALCDIKEANRKFNQTLKLLKRNIPFAAKLKGILGYGLKGARG